MEWEGSLSRTAISSEGVIDEKDPGNWNAAEKIPDPSARKIWGAIPGTDYTTDYNNFVESNYKLIDPMFGLLGNAVGDCLLYTSPSPRDAHESRMPSSA